MRDLGAAVFDRRPIRIVALTTGALLAGAALVAGPAPVAEAKPTFTVTKVVTGLTVPWDLTWVGDVMLFDERPGRLWTKTGSSRPKRVQIDLPSLLTESEGGLLGLVADPEAATNKLFYTCQSTKSGGTARDVRVLRWKLDDATHASAVGDPVITGLPIGSGRHNGCRLRFGPDGKLYVGTGDAVGTANPQSLASLGGKVLRVNANGSIPSDNPFFNQRGNARYVWTYGHRNVQGLAFRPGTDELWNAEHGTGRDDEINVDVSGANYGWQPGPGYDESEPMTNLKKFPDAVPARWSSGSPTVATSGITFLEGSAWGHWEGALAVGLLAGQGLRVMLIDPKGAVTGTTDVAGLSAYKRIRTTQLGPDGSLYFTTSNNDGHDVIAKITPTAKPPTVKAGTNVSASGVSAVRTGNDVYAFIRTTGDRIVFKRSSDDGRTWPSSWTSTGLTSTSAPAVASSASDRVDLVTRASSGAITHSWFLNGVRQGSTVLGGKMRTASISSLGDGTLDVLGLRVTGGTYRAHFDGWVWSDFTKLAPGGFTSAIGAAADRASGQTLLTVRGTTGRTYEKTITGSGDGGDWKLVDGLLWSARALGDRFPDRARIAVSRGSDGYVRLGRGDEALALSLKVTSDPDVVTRPDGSWIAFGRSTSGGLSYYDARPGGYRVISLGGTVR
jgi:glucose/arabinose dehydrogenase